jgi:hypothetical protein
LKVLEVFLRILNEQNKIRNMFVSAMKVRGGKQGISHMIFSLSSF